MRAKELLKVVSVPVVVASLCCLTPIVIVLFGFGSVAIAGSLADSLYGDYKWLFRSLGIVSLALSVFFYIRRQKGICTLDEAKKRRDEIINIIAITLTVSIAGYFIWLYVVLEYVGKFLKIWS